MERMTDAAVTERIGAAADMAAQKAEAVTSESKQRYTKTACR